MDFLQKAKAVVIGHAIGDALGVPVEFAGREELKKKPVTDMEGYGTYHMPKGSWSDDTSMVLCALDAINGYKISFEKVMHNFGRWYYKDEFTPTGEVFDAGNTCSIAIDNYFINKKNVFECGLACENNNGNGSLMRINPFALYTYRLDTDVSTKIQIIELASGLTHAHKRSKVACGFYTFVLWELLNDERSHGNRETIRRGLRNAWRFYSGEPELKHFTYKLCRQIADTEHIWENPEFKRVTEDDIISDGYVVHTLEAAIWCLYNTFSYEECVLKAVNLGDDTDTTAAVAGGLAGAMYGYDNIPNKWKEILIKRDYIEALCEKAFSK